MTGISVLSEFLGVPSARPNRNFSRVESAWGVSLPADYVEFAVAYGDATIYDRIFVCGPVSLMSYTKLMGLDLDEMPEVQGRVLPVPGGMLLWGNTDAGDQLFLVDRGGGRWTVSVFQLEELPEDQWVETNLQVVDWVRGVLAGTVWRHFSSTMPEWRASWNRPLEWVPMKESI